MLLMSVMANPREAADTKGERQEYLLALEQDLRRMVQGDKEALGHFYDETKTVVYGFVLSILKHTSDAEDVLQETYLRIYRNAERYEYKGNPMPWTLTIAKNLATDKLRERTRRSWVDTDDVQAGVADLPLDPGMDSEDRMMLEAALTTLHPEELQIVMLHAVGGMKHREIASMMELPLTTVLSKYHRSLKKLRRQWEEGHEQ